MAKSAAERISVIGLGKLGSCLAASLAYAGFTVVGTDIDEPVVEQIDAGKAPVPEPNLEEYLVAAGDNLTATTDTSAAVEETDATFIVVNTPSTEAGRYDLGAVNTVCERVGETLASKDDYHLVVLTSTVFPGSTTGTIKDTLEHVSGKAVGEDFGLVYSPEFIAIGNVIAGLEDPDFFLIGEYTERAGDIVEGIYDQLGEEATPMARMSPVEAEITKMAVNSYVTMKISYANTLGEICDGIGGDVDTVTEALALDSRIGGDYLSAGSRFGGPCFPRDNVAFSRLAKDAGTEAPLAEATDKVNDKHTTWIADAVRDVTPDGGSIAILGLTYKQGTYIVEESQGVALLGELSADSAGYDVVGYDPMAVDHGRTDGLLAPCHASLDWALEGVDTAVLTVPWSELESEDTYRDRSLTLVDPWRLLNVDALPPDVRYVPVGARQKMNSLKAEQSAHSV